MIFKKILITFTVFLSLSVHAQSESFYYLTHYASTPGSKSVKKFVVDDPKYSDTIAVVDADKISIYDKNCSASIVKKKSFSQDRVFVDVIDDFGGVNNFKKFLSKKLKTNINSWKNEYIVKQNDFSDAALGCELLNSAFIIDSPNEIIFADISHFYRFKAGNPPK